MLSHLSFNAKMASIKGLIVAVATAIIYLLVVILTTPSLSPVAAVKAALTINSLIIIGTSVGVGTQIFISSYSKSMGCRLDNKKKGVFGAGSGSSALSSFFSFFSLVPLGCCGSWLLVLSYLPSVFGNTLSVALIQYSRPLSYIGLAIVFSFAALFAYKLHKELKLRKKGNQKVQEGTRIEGQ
ncbi:MAG: hypothetical protein ABJB85_10300 [Nitrososphaerota archaeon]